MPTPTATAVEPHYHLWVLSDDGATLRREPFVFRSRTPAYRALNSRGIEGKVVSCQDEACDVDEHAVCPTCGHRLHRG